VSLEKVTVINESCEKEQKKLEEKLELLLMEQKRVEQRFVGIEERRSGSQREASGTKG